MRAYLEHFFKEYDYSERDSDELLRAYDAVVACKEANVEWDALVDAYTKDIGCDLEQ